MRQDQAIPNWSTPRSPYFRKLRSGSPGFYKKSGNFWENLLPSWSTPFFLAAIDQEGAISWIWPETPSNRSFYFVFWNLHESFTHEICRNPFNIKSTWISSLHENCRFFGPPTGEILLTPPPLRFTMSRKNWKIFETNVPPPPPQRRF